MTAHLDVDNAVVANSGFVSSYLPKGQVQTTSTKDNYHSSNHRLNNTCNIIKSMLVTQTMPIEQSENTDGQPQLICASLW